MTPTPDIAVLWRKSDRSTCVLTKRGTTLFLSVQRDGRVVMEKAVESPTEATELAKAWKDASRPPEIERRKKNR